MGGIGGVRALGFGPNRVNSFPDGVATVLQEYLLQRDERIQGGDADTRANHLKKQTGKSAVIQQLSLPAIGDLCPECGQATLIMEEGCCKCYSCGYSEC